MSWTRNRSSHRSIALDDPPIEKGGKGGFSEARLSYPQKIQIPLIPPFSMGEVGNFLVNIPLSQER